MIPITADLSSIFLISFCSTDATPLMHESILLDRIYPSTICRSYGASWILPRLNALRCPSEFNGTRQDIYFFILRRRIRGRWHFVTYWHRFLVGQSEGKSLKALLSLSYFFPHTRHVRFSSIRSPHSHAQAICLPGFPTIRA